MPLLFLTSAASIWALSGTIALRIIPVKEGVPDAVQASPAIMFGLFLHYAFLRFPLHRPQ